MSVLWFWFWFVRQSHFVAPAGLELTSPDLIGLLPKYWDLKTCATTPHWVFVCLSIIYYLSIHPCGKGQEEMPRNLFRRKALKADLILQMERIQFGLIYTSDLNRNGQKKTLAE